LQIVKNKAVAFFAAQTGILIIVAFCNVVKVAARNCNGQNLLTVKSSFYAPRAAWMCQLRLWTLAAMHTGIVQSKSIA
jgi:hypothetical protein